VAAVDITIDGLEVVAQPGQTVLEAAQAPGIDVPTLCHHPALEPIGACRVCLVEIEKQLALQPACTLQVTPGMVVHTDFARLFKRLGARSLSSLKPVPEFLTKAEGQSALLDEALFYLSVGEDLSIDHQVAGFVVRRGVMNRGAHLAIVDATSLAQAKGFIFSRDET